MFSQVMESELEENLDIVHTNVSFIQEASETSLSDTLRLHPNQ